MESLQPTARGGSAAFQAAIAVSPADAVLPPAAPTRAPARQLPHTRLSVPEPPSARKRGRPSGGAGLARGGHARISTPRRRFPFSIHASTTHSTAVQAPALAVDWRRLAERTKLAEDELGADLVNISGNTMELDVTDAVLEWMLCGGEGIEDYKNFDLFRNAAHKVVLDELVRDHGWTAQEIKHAYLDSPSLLICTGGPGQVYHIDTKWHRATAFVAATDNLIPTKLYDEKLMGPAPAQDASFKDWETWAFRPLEATRAQLAAGMVDLGENPWKAGTVGVMSGRRVHAGPPVPLGTLRIVYFFTIRRRFHKKYIQYRQITQFTHLLAAGTEDDFKQSLRDWTSHEPWQHWAEDDEVFADAIENYCKGAEGAEGVLDPLVAERVLHLETSSDED